VQGVRTIFYGKVMSQINEEKMLLQELINVFETWAQNACSEKFTQAYFLKSTSPQIREKYEKKIKKQTGFWTDCLIKAKINPNCFSNQKIKGTENRLRLLSALNEIKNAIGVENLNDSTMNNTKNFIDLPKALVFAEGDFERSDKYGIKPTISLAAFQRRCFKEFGSWDETLRAANIDISTVKRKTASHSLSKLLEWFDTFVVERSNIWTVTTIRDDDHALFRAIGNNSQRIKQSEIMPTDKISDEYIFNFWVMWRYWKEFNSLDFDFKWYEERSEELKNEYELKHRAQERWSLEKIQKQALELYVEGNSFSREDLNLSAKGKRLLAAMRGNRFSKTGSEVEVLFRIGVQVESLRSLKGILQDYSLEHVYVELRKIMSESLVRNENLLSRENMQKNNQDIFYAAIRWQNRLSNTLVPQNDWSKTLSFFGLNPGSFELNASKRGRRGAAFQRFFEGIIREKFVEVYAPEDVKSKDQACFNKSFSENSCDHNIRCKPDFVFLNCIIDTKVGGSLAKVEQLERYLEHCKEVFIITINDKPKKVDLNGRVIEILGFKEFLHRSEEIIGVSFDEKYIDDLSEVLRISSAFSIE
jgi:hypothetical protein